jgi:hypothetical protein
MKKFLPFYIIASVFAFTSCQKEYSTESGGDSGAGAIIGADCRISKIAYTDSATGLVGYGSIGATINAADLVTDVTKFDSLSLTIDFNSQPQYFTDTVAIDPDQYFIVDLSTQRVTSFHGLTDPTVPGSPEFDVAYVYDGAGHLSQKSYYFTLSPVVPYLQTNYTYTNGNLTGMTLQDMFTGDLVKDASLSYYSNIAPKNYLYLFPDESTYAEFSQFYNFGAKSYNAVKSLKVRYYDPGNVVVDSTVSNFNTYIMSRDNYVTSVIMSGNDQSSIPAIAGKLKFSYKCK